MELTNSTMEWRARIGLKAWFCLFHHMSWHNEWRPEG